MNPENAVINVFVVAGAEIVRAGLFAVLQPDANIFITGGAAEIPDPAFDFSVNRTTFDVLLIAVERQTEFVALSVFLDHGDVELHAESFAVVALLAPEFQSAGKASQLLRAGVRGLLPFEADGEEIAAAINAAANDLFTVEPEIMNRILSRNASEDFTSPNAENDFAGGALP